MDSSWRAFERKHYSAHESNAGKCLTKEKFGRTRAWQATNQKTTALAASCCLNGPCFCWVLIGWLSSFVTGSRAVYSGESMEGSGGGWEETTGTIGNQNTWPWVKHLFMISISTHAGDLLRLFMCSECDYILPLKRWRGRLLGLSCSEGISSCSWNV